MPSALWRVVLVATGTTFVGLGVLGIFLPLMPTTIFLILAAACYARSSDRFYQRLVNHRVLGAYLRAAGAGCGMPRRAKIVTLVLLWASIGASIVWSVDALWVRLLLLAIAVGVTVHVARIPVFVPAERTLDRAADRPLT